ncbi:MAG: rnhB [Burkholderiales bacterium]|jgi:ribonuclease HII|nr:rnhB [Burkholderiales bacterium]
MKSKKPTYDLFSDPYNSHEGFHSGVISDVTGGSLVLATPYYTCGVDEAGRGPLAGRVYAAAVILNPNNPIAGLADSKILSQKIREELYSEIVDKAIAYCIAYSEVEEIEQLNILQATFLAMQRAIERLKVTPSLALIDGNHIPPKLQIKAEAIIKGDSKIAEISAASILAKVARDTQMYELDKQYPQYGFANHKGYGTKEHMLAIDKYGVLPIHRKTFAPIKKVLYPDLLL